MRSLNLGLIAGRRPDLVSRTLGSFRERLFDHVKMGCVRVNLDPIFGSQADAERVVDIVRGHFPDAEIRQPETPGFAAAVHWVWAGMPDGVFLHLEDDWLCHEDLPWPDIDAKLTGNTKMVTLVSETHGTRALRAESTRTEKKKFLGLTYSRREVPTFNTSPGFVDGAFARSVAERFDLSLDPEKQMRNRRNPALCDYLQDYRCMFQPASDGGPVVEDIGRDWSAAKGIRKELDGAKTRWVKTAPKAN